MTAERPTFSAAELALKAVDHNPRHSFGTETPDIFKDDEIIENHSVRPSSSLATAFVTDEPDKHRAAGIDAKTPRLNVSSSESVVRTIGYFIGCDIISFHQKIYNIYI